jgi:hypothetical protein
MFKKWMLVSWSVFALAGCLTDETPEETPAQAEPVVCSGPKCDGLSDKFRDAFDDMKNVDLGDLTVLGAGLADDALNDQLQDIPYSNIQLSNTALYGTGRTLLGQTVIHELSELRAGLTERFGESALASHVVGLRQAQSAERDVLWAESHFQIGPALRPNWGIDAGDGVVGNVGFDASAAIETVVIAPYDDANDALVDNPLEALRAARGWVLPRSLADVQSMAPGESLSMRANGALGLNLGVGVPFLLGTIADAVVLNARLSLGARVGLSGKLDVQLIRGESDIAWVDVGLDEQAIRAFSVALTSGWGVAGLPAANLDLGIKDLNVTKIAEKALQKQLNTHLNASLSATTSSSSQRLTVARFRFNTQAATAEVEQALAQAMRGDIRLAQALSIRPGSGVVQELDFTKDSRSESNYVGFRFLGMEFYRANGYNTGTIHIEADGDNQTILFSELEEKSGLFFTDRAWEYRNLVSIKSSGGQVTEALVNARITLREGDSFLERDQMLDHVDPFLGYVVGFDPIWSGVGAEADALAHYVDNYCPRPNNSTITDRDYRECLAGLPENSDVLAERANVERAADEALAGPLAQGFSDANSAREIAQELLNFKVESSFRNDRPDVAFFGPKGKMVTQIRLSHDAMHEMMTIGKHQEFRARLEEVLRLMAVERVADAERRQDKADDFIERRSGRLDELAQIYALATVEWADLEDIAAVSLNNQTVGNEGHMVLVDTRNQNAIDVASVAEFKGRVVERMIPALIDKAEAGILYDLDEPEGFVIAYALLWLVDPSGVEVMANYMFDQDEDNAFPDLTVYGRGSAKMIDAGQFDLEQIIGAR